MTAKRIISVGLLLCQLLILVGCSPATVPATPTAGIVTTEEPPHQHKFEGVQVTQTPCIVAGEQLAACACGETVTSPLPATGLHVYENGICLGCGQNEIPLTAVSSLYDADSDGKNDVFYFSPLLSDRFANAVHVWAGDYDKSLSSSKISNTTAADIRHWYIGDESQSIVYHVTVPEAGLYEMVIHVRMKDAQARGAKYTVNGGTDHVQIFETSHAFTGVGHEQVRDADTLSSYMYGITVNLVAGENTVQIQQSSACSLSQHFRDLYFVRVGDPHVHSYETITVTLAATCADDGEERAVCSCGRTRVAVLPATKAHTYVNDVCSVCHRVYRENGILYYDFLYDLPGFAGGTVEFLPTATDTYTFYWGDTNGKLKDYTMLYSDAFEQGVTAEVSIQSFTAIPEGATRLLVCNRSGEVVSSYDLPEERLFTRTALYSFGAISDTHQGTRYGPTSFAYERTLHVLKTLADQGVSLVGICGDITYVNEEFEYILHAEVIQEFYRYAPRVPVYTVSGNHEAKFTGFSKLWYQTYAQNAVTYDTDLKPIFSDGNDLDFVVELPDGSVMIYLHQIYYDYGKKTSRLLDDSQLDWLGARLEQYQDRTVFLFFHTQLDDEVGDATSIGGVEGSLSLIAGTVDHTRLTEYFTKYTNVVYFSGHSHFPFDVQFVTPKAGKTNYNKNIDNKNGTFATMVHIPSAAAVSEISDESTSSKANNQRSEGYIVYVYEDCVVFRGYDFVGQQTVAYANYIIQK
ncbi:MAG: metallophosphoesterase family protein [Clostridia bacterium]|nr:metallophosphoesterase family protein [Clostridia bacterium]